MQLNTSSSRVNRNALCPRGSFIDSQLGCPRNNQIFFSVRTETQSVSVVFRFVSRNQKTFFSVCFGLFRCFGPVSKQPKQTEFSRNKPKQTKKIPKKTLSIRGYSKPLIFFLGLNRNSICFGCFSVCFFAK